MPLLRDKIVCYDNRTLFYALMASHTSRPSRHADDSLSSPLIPERAQNQRVDAREALSAFDMREARKSAIENVMKSLMRERLR